MHNERVTYLTSAERKAELEAFAKARGESVGSVLREATARYIAEPQSGPTPEEEEALKALVNEVNDAIPLMNASLEDMSKTIRKTRSKLDKTLREAGIRK
ncbi:hypothetical protein [Alterisphingorhabdus coralli]|uniref:Uncharacterized protein n=1 Tax=Alterisphingorhabdus coralli TaxID=3071408 RepID=A0AA97I0Q4_9SPHN|nr:hypothetical protein [Parasphingorhabdus sp. SCSIO 66989]WOE74000.1 hypothetical protein RB602_09000 [Parasphingorhabdus sp. SCSIO 66989]